MLWINMIMDSLASLALATEPPTEALLDRAPVNRSDSIITPRMWTFIVGHSMYQVRSKLCCIVRCLPGPRSSRVFLVPPR